MFDKTRIAVMLGSAMAVFPWQAVAETDQEATVSIPNITVTADPLGNRGTDELIIPVSVLTGDELNKNRAATLGETLDKIPGVANSDFGPGVGRPVIRGLQGSRVQVLEDGLKTSDISGEGADHPVAIDGGRAEQIEVFRGPATLLYGSGAAGGVINVKTNRFNPEFGDKPSVNGELKYGTNGNDRQGRLGLELPVTDQLVLRADYGVRRSHDFDIDGYQEHGQHVGDKDTLQNSDSDQDSIGISALYKGDWGYAGVGYSRWKTDFGVPEVFLGEGEEEKERIRADYDRVDFHSEIYNPLPGFETARLKLSHTAYDQQEVGYEFDGGQFEESLVETEFENDETDMRLELVHNPIGMWQGVIGLQFNDRDFDAAGEGHGHEEGGEHEHGSEGFYVRPNETQSWGLFALEERLTDFGRLEFAARVDHVRSKPAALAEERHIEIDGIGDFEQGAVIGDESFTPFSLSAGAIIDIDESHHLRFGLTRSERAPSPEQLYAFGEHAAAKTVEIGDPDLDTERYTNFEIGFDRHAGAFRYDATVFYNRVNEYIFSSPVDNGSGQAVTIDGNTLVVNQQDDAEFYGAEIGVVWDMVEGNMPVSLRFSGDHVRGKLRDGGDLPRMSPTRLGIGIDTSYQDWDLSVDYRRVFKQTKTAVAETDTDGYNQLGFDVFWRPANFNGGEVFLQGRNLLNEDGRRHQSFLKDDAPIIGRTIMTGVRFNFGG